MSALSMDLVAHSLTGCTFECQLDRQGIRPVICSFSFGPFTFQWFTFYSHLVMSVCVFDSVEVKTNMARAVRRPVPRSFWPKPKAIGKSKQAPVVRSPSFGRALFALAGLFLFFIWSSAFASIHSHAKSANEREINYSKVNY